MPSIAGLKKSAQENLTPYRFRLPRTEMRYAANDGALLVSEPLSPGSHLVGSETAQDVEERFNKLLAMLEEAATALAERDTSEFERLSPEIKSRVDQFNPSEIRSEITPRAFASEDTMLRMVVEPFRGASQAEFPADAIARQALTTKSRVRPRRPRADAPRPLTNVQLERAHLFPYGWTNFTDASGKVIDDPTALTTLRDTYTSGHALTARYLA